MGSESSEKNQLGEFIKRIENLYEVEYGDFKRKVSLYINRLEQNYTDAPSRQIIKQMRQHVLYNTDADIEMAREKTLALARKLH